MTMHLRADKISDVVATVWPFELTIAFNLGVFHLTAIDVVFILFNCTRTYYFDESTPLLKSFAVNFLPVAEVSCDFNCSEFEFFYALAFHFVADPEAVVL